MFLLCAKNDKVQRRVEKKICRGKRRTGQYQKYNVNFCELIYTAGQKFENACNFLATYEKLNISI